MEFETQNKQKKKENIGRRKPSSPKEYVQNIDFFKSILNK